MAKQWYTRKSGGDPNTPSDYVPSGQTPPECPGEGAICAIFAENGASSRPVIDQALQDEMVTALSQGDTQNVLLREEDQ